MNGVDHLFGNWPCCVGAEHDWLEAGRLSFGLLSEAGTCPYTNNLEKKHLAYNSLKKRLKCESSYILRQISLT